MQSRRLRFWLSLSPILLFGFALFESRPPVAAAPAPTPSLETNPLPAGARKLEPALLKQLLGEPERPVPFIAHLEAKADLPAAHARQSGEQRAAVVRSLQETAQRTQADVLAVLATHAAAGTASQIRPLWIVNAVAARGTRETILAVAALPEVASVRADPLRQWLPEKPAFGAASSATAVEWNIARIGAERVWSTFGIDGSGVVVANLDTGVDWQHPALLSRYRGYRDGGPAVHEGNWFDATGYGYVYPGDGYGHGTHTMGILVGGEGIGVAPGARWIAAKIFDSLGRAQDSWIHAAFQWVMAPAGDPSLAPDIVSNSWGNDAGLDSMFADDVRTLRAAGILPVFSNGNNGPGTGTVASPASFAESVGVGASDSFEAIAYFSARGPSPINGQIKPEVVAPGVDVRSSATGGGYRVASGTSMAAPHVAGAAALLKQAQPNSTLTETLFVITATALPISAPVPNNDSGWGRVDAYQAVLWVVAHGTLSGTVSAGGAPLAGARIVTVDAVGRMVETSSGTDGGFELMLAPGQFRVSASAFGYETSRSQVVTIKQGQVTLFNADLTRLPSGMVRGRVTGSASGAPLTATVQAIDTPAATTAGADGTYALTLPVGTFTLRATSWGYRVVTATALVQANAVISVDIVLPAAPTILIVDSGAWYGSSQAVRFQSALESLGYLQHTHSVTKPAGGAPSLAQLSSYSITIWSAPDDSPAYIGAGGILKQYLDGAGRLLLTGQDIAYWDGGGPGNLDYDYFPTRLHGRYATDSVPLSRTYGIPGGALAGITLTMNTPDSARNQFLTDAVIALDEQASPLMRYGNDAVAGLAVEMCVPQRAAYLAFGLEGAGPLAARTEALRRLINWLMDAPPAHGLFVTADPDIAVGLPGSTRAHAFTVRNTGTQADTLSMLASARWPTDIYDAQTGLPVTSVVHFDSCERRHYETRTAIPSGTPRNTADVASVTIQSLGSPAITATRAMTTKTPGPVLLVDDDRWYPQESKYTDALSGAGISFDVFDTRGGAGPALSQLNLYPVVVWFAGYDWFDPLNDADEQNLAAYLDNGGRLFYTAQDYLDVRFAKSDFAPNYLGVLSYTNDVTVTTLRGTVGHPASDGLGPFALSYPYANWSDTLTPTVAAMVAFTGNESAPTVVSVRHPSGLWKTVFAAVPFETLPAANRSEVMQSIVGWLSPLGDSALVAPPSAAARALITYRIEPRSAFPTYASQAQITVTLPASVRLDTLGDPALTYDAQTRRIGWSGPATTTAPLTFSVSLNPTVPPGARFAAQITVRDTDEGMDFTRHVWTFVEGQRTFLPVITR